MKQRIIGIIIAFICLLDAKQGLSQTPPNGMLYQAVARDAMLRLARNRTVFIRTSLIQGNPTGSVVYSEEHISNTNVEGVFSIVIGKGINKTGTYTDIKSIPWSSDRFYFNIQLSVAPVLPSTGWMPSYVDMGTTEFWTVPYAFYSGSAQTSSDSLKLVINKENRSISLGNYLPIEFSVRDEDSDSPNELQRLTRDGGRVSLNQKGGFIFLPDSSAINEIQSLILDGGRISLSLGGGTISLPDSSSSNELQKLSQSGNTISLSNGGGSVSITDNDKQSLSLKSGSLSISNGNSVTLPDSDNTNEIQKLGISGGRVTLDNGGGSISLPDSSSNNELQKLSQSGNTISLSNGGGSVSITDNDKQSLSLKSGSLSISNGNSVTLPDSDNTNEIQKLGISGGRVTLDNGGGSISLPDSSSGNELQKLSQSGNTISLSNGGGSVSITDNDKQSLSLKSGSLSISNGNSVTLPDSDNTNEIQKLGISGGRVTLDNGGGSISLPDSSSNNELQKLSQSGNTISLSNGGGSVSITDNDKQSLSLKSGSLSISNGNSVTLPDSDNTNEIQKLGISGGRVTLDNGGGSISLPDSSSSNELQKLSQSGNTISLSNGGGSVSITDNDKQSLSLKSGSLSISNGNSVTLPDSDNTNEIQKLGISGGRVTLDNGGGSISLPDSSSGNELQKLSQSG